ncbi:putative ABC transport system permease protein [Pseudomonas pohangensis]|jgi:putative ABC transport system permease protein|uniref:Putative ABC transport system permease protein n=1 Tax=Pseudomonas pohangensis TaxID=364197 RepID=A0A1H2HTF1_9PSED|nr:ABC transporter permease [Pseudomonas pohangensis]SDU34966.1 putative ABC transport system permease protein [Pseudomonas pohangensis]
MRSADALRLCLGALRGHSSRSLMLLLAVAIGVIAVNLLTGLGDGARQFVLGEFSALGRNTLIIMPGRKETTGGMPPITGLAPRDLTLQDAAAIGRLPQVRKVAPLQAGQMELSVAGRSREAFTIGTSRDFFAIRQLAVSQGQMLPALALDEALAVCVIGQKLRRELFGQQPALGEWLRAGNRRFRVIGILAERGQSLGTDFSEAIIIPVANAQALFNREGLFRVFAEVRSPAQINSGKRQILALLKERHEGKEDVTVISQDSMLSTFNDILGALTMAVGGIAAISMLVAGILIMNVTWIAVSQRTPEIGLLKAIGASAAQVRLLFLGEAALLAVSGALGGLLLGELLLWLGRWLWELPLYTPMWARITSLLLALATALLFAWLPASRAAAMEPLAALRPAGART